MTGQTRLLLVKIRKLGPCFNEYIFSKISLFCMKAGDGLYRSPVAEADFVLNAIYR